MSLKFTWWACMLQVALFSVVVKFSRQHPQNAVASEAQLKTDKNLCELNIHLPDESFRSEIAKLQTSEGSKEDLSITGFIRINFIENNAMANWTYIADKNGFFVHYIYKQLKDTQQHFSNTSTASRPTPPLLPYSTTPPPPLKPYTTKRPYIFRRPAQGYKPQVSVLSANALKSSGG